MTWGSVSAFLAMGGYGGYVWGSYGVTTLCIVLEIAALIVRQRKLLRK